jgi:nucleotide-binding universal stress UspA family protein
MLRSLLVAVDVSSPSPGLLEHARAWASACDARIRLVHVAEPDPDFVGSETGPPSERDAVAARLREAHLRTQVLAEELRLEGFDATALTVPGATAEALLDQAERLGIDLILVGTHRRGPWGRLWHGSVSETLARRARIPVLVVPPSDSPFPPVAPGPEFG